MRRWDYFYLVVTLSISVNFRVCWTLRVVLAVATLYYHTTRYHVCLLFGGMLRWLRRSATRLLAWCCMRRGAPTTQHAIKDCGSQRRLRRRIQIRTLCMRTTYIFHMHRLPVRLLAIFQPLRFSELNGAPLKKCFINPSSSFLSFAPRSAPLIAFSIWQSYNSQWISNSWHLHTII